MMAVQCFAPPAMRAATWQQDMAVVGDFARGLGVARPLFSAGGRAHESAVVGLSHYAAAALRGIPK